MFEKPIMYTQSPMATKTISRLLFVDNWRLALIILMVVHHVAVIYGAGSPFYYMEPPWQDPWAFLTLLIFVLINQSWFMGAFFLISGYFTPQSFDSKGAGSFLKDRLLRLGIPLVIFIFVLNPIASIGIYQMPASLTGITEPFTWQQYPKLTGPGSSLVYRIAAHFRFWLRRVAQGDKEPCITGCGQFGASRLSGDWCLYSGLGAGQLFAAVRDADGKVHTCARLSHTRLPSSVPAAYSFWVLSHIATIGSRPSATRWERWVCCGRGGDTPAVSGCDGRHIELARQRDLAICGLCALGFNRCSRDVPGFDHDLSKFLQPAGRARQFPLRSIVIPYSLYMPRFSFSWRWRCVKLPLNIYSNSSWYQSSPSHFAVRLPTWCERYHSHHGYCDPGYLNIQNDIIV